MIEITTPSQVDYSEAEKAMYGLIRAVEAYIHLEAGEVEKILWNTYVFARDAHHGQIRKSGEPYIIHPIQAAYLLLHLKPDIVTLQSCILHDVIEDTEYDREAIKKNF